MKTYFIQAVQIVFCPVENRNIREQLSRNIQAENKPEAVDDFIESICDDQGRTFAQIEPSIKIKSIKKIN
jgi:hypothetical protein